MWKLFNMYVSWFLNTFHKQTQSKGFNQGYALLQSLQGLFRLDCGERTKKTLGSSRWPVEESQDPDPPPPTDVSVDVGAKAVSQSLIASSQCTMLWTTDTAIRLAKVFSILKFLNLKDGLSQHLDASWRLWSLPKASLLHLCVLHNLSLRP